MLDKQVITRPYDNIKTFASTPGQGRGKHWVDANTTDVLLPGKTPESMIAHYLELQTNAQERMKKVERARAPLAIVDDRIDAWVDRQSAYFEPKELGTIDGMMFLPNRADGFAMLCSIMPDEIKAAMKRKARAKYNLDNTMSPADRRDTLAELEKVITDCARKGLFWCGECERAGIKGTGFPTTNIEAVLDIVEVR